MNRRTNLRAALLLALGGTVSIAEAQRLELGVAQQVIVRGAAGEVLPPSRANTRILPRSSGSVVLVRQSEPYVFEIDTAGGARRFGRTGDGPIEFQRVAAAGFLGDTLWVADGAHQRLTFFPLARTEKPFSRQFRDSSGFRSPVLLPFALMGGGRALAVSIAESFATAPETTRKVPLVLARSSGGPPAELVAIVDVLSMQHEIAIGPNRQMLVRAQPYLDRSLIGVSSRGKYVALVNQADGGRDRPERHELAIFSEGGRLKTRVPLPLVARPISSADRTRLTDVGLASLNEIARMLGRPSISRPAYAAGLFIPREWTRFVDAIVSDDGDVLLRGNDWVTPVVTYHLLDSSGQTRARFEVPRLQSILAMDRTHMWSLAENKDGEVSLIRQSYRIVSQANRN